MKRTIVYTILSVLSSTVALAQLDSIQKLDEVYIIDSKLKAFSDGYKIRVLTDSLLQRNTYSLTDVLRYNSQIYFKENGYGGVSSPSFRGTNASQTAVIWNGIAINSPLTGQTDFNTITTFSSSEITIRPGGGSSQFGSGAVGGSVHLSNAVSFTNDTETTIRLGQGSFETYFGNASFKKSTDRYYIKIATDYIDSKNNYPFVDRDQSNQNGEFDHANVALDAATKWDKHTLSFHSNYYQSDRAFAGTLNTINQDGYENLNTRNLLTYVFKQRKWSANLKFAHLFEAYTYFPDRTTDENISEGESTQFIYDQQLSYRFNNKIEVGTISNITRILGEGTNIGKPSRNTVANVAFAKHTPFDWLTYTTNVRYEFGTRFKNPFLAAIDGTIKISEATTMKFNGSKNYRVPTFNDLYWDSGGNRDLEPENSYQGELGMTYSRNKLKLTTAAFYIATKDLIKWQPNTSGVWSPVNIQETKHYGVEVAAEYAYHFHDHTFQVAGNYNYTKAIDIEKEAQLIYVPFHSATGLLGYQHKEWNASVQSLYTGAVFTTSDNNNSIDGYFIANASAEYNLKKVKIPATVGLTINNVFNIYYENVAFRPMPGINYKLTINFKF